ncbi:uncharacterized protein PHACADRAFT_260256 [Phanerochaete carnosa HHB-10118-sp]|uniref:Heterokaryon incompatibility domain-containing protein n=1 Tax=Phanerochaete carnosa (strain HHB-10118-sp) TaxID=650164 RepID=K5VQL8_PHACS|nr:uncharacterized protein PHACADRAFT_260256 [Phanerochaete carnosa HHB-10118-sp]EKM53763.1 hypothetical protein PHACADRAFT_260256 [Phanerochaete carnosa HHB-10118-sp]
MDTKRLLELLNDVLATNYSLEKPGMEQCLNHFLRTSRDFGQVYASLRRYWRSGFTQLLPDLAKYQKEDESKRRNALGGGYISNSRLPPRRVWDLYSNRVLPFYAIKRGLLRFLIFDEVWTVSHSWVHESVRTDVWTLINDNQWPVPIPGDTTLEHVRVELLNLGAEYVWMDVLCLRQRGRPGDEEQRKEEWKLDVPTIGYVYSHLSSRRPCVTYFNGLGLPFDPSPQVLSSDRHWLNRAWTVQEAINSWLPGGTTGAVSADALRFFQEHLPRSIPQEGLDFVPFAASAMRGRHCTTELDRIHGLAYLLNCSTLPIYDEGMPPELAWTMLLKHLSPYARRRVASRHAWCHPDDTSLLPSWKDFMQCERDDIARPLDSALADSALYLLDDSRLHVHEPGVYCHYNILSHGPVSIDCEGKKDESGYETLKLQYRDVWNRLLRFDIKDCEVAGTFLPGVKYAILDLPPQVWLIVEVIGEREVEGTAALEVVKRGCVFPLSNQLPPLIWYKRRIVHISEEEAR